MNAYVIRVERKSLIERKDRSSPADCQTRKSNRPSGKLSFPVNHFSYPKSPFSSKHVAQLCKTIQSRSVRLVLPSYSLPARTVKPKPLRYLWTETPRCSWDIFKWRFDDRNVLSPYPTRGFWRKLSNRFQILFVKDMLYVHTTKTIGIWTLKKVFPTHKQVS